MSSSRVSWTDLRSMARCIGEVGCLAADPSRQRQEFLKRVAHLLGAKVAVALTAELPAHASPTLVPIVWHGWLSQAQQAIFVNDAATHAYRANPLLNTLWRWPRRPNSPIGRLRRQCVQDSAWYGSEYVQQTYRTLDIDDLLIAVTPKLAGAPQMLIAALRPWADPTPFSARERSLAELLIEAWAGLCTNQDEGAANANLIRLPRRLAQVRDLLLQGLTEKQAAYRLGLSSHTVHRHTSRLYRVYGVSSRAELLIRCLEQ